jgi:hypothetical protein
VLEPVAVAVPIVGAPGTTATTVAVVLELAVTPDGAIELVAVTWQKIPNPTSAATNTYVLEVAPPIDVLGLLNHWYVNVGAGAPVHVPLVVVSVEPNEAVPVTAGATVLTGAAP